MNLLLFTILFIILVLILSFIISEFTYNKFIKGGKSKKLRLKTAAVLKKQHHNSDNKHNSNNKHNSDNKQNSDNKHNSDKKQNSDVYAMTMTYTISGENNGLDFSQLRQLLTEAKELGFNFTEVPVTEKAHISFGTFKNDAVVKGEIKRWNYDPLFFKQKTAIKNTLGEHHQLINKSELYDTIKRLIPNGIKYLPKCYNAQEIEQAFHNNTIKYPLIIKKDNVPQQQAIQIVLSKEEYYKAIKDLDIKNKNNSCNAPKGLGDAMVSEYITNPLLLDGKKFHLRVYFLLSVISGITKCVFYRQYRILTAKLNYIKEDWLNREIHLSGGHYTKQRYNYPEDLQKEYPDHFLTIEKNLNACNKTICMAMTMANVKNYSESYAGYHLYGADIMLTDNYHPYLLEINSKPGFSEYGENIGWEEYNKQFSYNFFSFILNSTVFPYFGIASPPIYDAEFIGDGVLTSFAHILTSNNKCFFIPYLDANKSEIKQAKQIHFFNKGVLFQSMINDCEPYNIFLIANVLSKLDILNLQSGKKVIGYLVLTKKNDIKLAIKEEFQNRGIGAAIIAQFIEIYFSRHFTQSKIEPLYIEDNNIFMYNIAKKLQFEKNKNVFVKHNRNSHAIIKSQMQHHLTYKIIYENSEQKQIFSELNKYMTISNSQFVSFIYNKLGKNVLNIKHSTGSRYDKNFIYQGAELKSSLDIKMLFNSYTLKKHIYDNNDNMPIYFFDKKVNVLEKSKTYIAHNYKKAYNEIITNEIITNDTNTNFLNNEEYLVEEYNKPYLLDKKLMGLRCPILIYISNNGIIKLFIFPKKQILIAIEEYDIDKLNDNNSILIHKNTTKKTSEIKELNHITDDELNIIIKDIFVLLLPNIKLYPESNSGFLECIIDFKFIKTNEKYQPVIHRVFNYNSRSNFYIDDEYLIWLQNCVILPHFGLSSYKITIPSYSGALLKHIYSAKIQYSIIEKIHLELNIPKIDTTKIDTTKIEVKVNYNSDAYAEIKLHIKQNEIYIISPPHFENKTNIEINIIFMLMEILRAYYAPIQMFLLLKYEKNNDIAFELEFAKRGDYYIKKC